VRRVLSSEHQVALLSEESCCVRGGRLQLVEPDDVVLHGGTHGDRVLLLRARDGSVGLREQTRRPDLAPAFRMARAVEERAKEGAVLEVHASEELAVLLWDNGDVWALDDVGVRRHTAPRCFFAATRLEGSEGFILMDARGVVSVLEPREPPPPPHRRRGGLHWNLAEAA
jgi:hypothetical protein